MTARATRIAFVGLGAMGARMARRLLEAGHELAVWNRTPERARPLVELGAAAAGSPAEAAAEADAAIVMVSDGAALAAVVDGPDGIAAVDSPLTLIQMSTVGVAATAELAARLPRHVALLDAPVLGSLAEAESGSLTIFAGGDAGLVERCAPILALLGSILHVGPVGHGQAAKLVANATLFGALGVLGESLALADGLGLPRETAFEVLAASPLAAQAERRRPVIEAGEYPPRFTVSLARKDGDLIAEAGAGRDLRVIDAWRSWLAEADARGFGERDYSAIFAAILEQ